MSGLVAAPAQIWLVVTPVDIPKGHKCAGVLMAYRRLSSKHLGILPVQARRLYFTTARVIA
ncbi:MAG: hypothetical protein Q8S55_00235 [Methylococcaceae bacterium]|nr:hypothetical protein [Methylococcaceae bacterium]